MTGSAGRTRAGQAAGSAVAGEARTRGRAPEPHSLLRLQRACGNRAVAGLLAGGPVVQRNVGFEFQTFGTGTGFYPNREATNDPKNKLNKGKIAYYEGDGFTVEGDEGDLELVTKPFEETEQGYQELWKTLIWMEMFAERLQGKTVPLETSLLAHLKPTEALERGGQVVLKGDSKVLADPQATVGIGLGKLRELAELLSSAPSRKSAVLYKDNAFVRQQGVEPTRLTPRLQRRDAKGLAEHIGWKAYQSDFFQTTVMAAAVKFPGEVGGNDSAPLSGFLFLLAQHVLATNQYAAAKVSKGELPYWVKLAVPVMSRTNLADLFRKLPEADRERFSKNIGHIGKKLGEHSSEGVAFPAGLGGETLKDAVGIETWLTRLVPAGGVNSAEPGIDLSSRYESMGDISNREFPDFQGPPWGDKDAEARNKSAAVEKNKFRARYLKSMESSIDIGPATHLGAHRLEGAIVELRKLGAKLLPEEWLPFAAAVFELTVLLNQGEQRRSQIIN